MNHFRTIAVFCFFLINSMLVAQSVSITHSGQLGGWTLDPESNEFNYKIYFVDTKGLNTSNLEDFRSQVFINGLQNGGINLVAQMASLDGFYSGYVNSMEYGQYLEAYRTAIANGSKVLNHSEYLQQKYPDGIPPDMQQASLDGYKTIYFATYEDNQGVISRNYTFYVFIKDNVGVIINGNIYYVDKKSSYSLGQYEQILLDHINELRFSYTGSKSTDTTGNEPIIKEENDYWIVIIGILAAGAAIAAINRLRRKNGKKEKEKEKKKEEKEKFILNLNKDQFNLQIDKPQELLIEVWKIKGNSKKRVNAPINIQNPEKSLKINPGKGKGTLKTQLLLKDITSKSPFKLIISSVAEGHPVKTEVNITADSEDSLIIRTEPGNKRSIRPNINQVLTCYAQIKGEDGKPDKNLTSKIKFKPKSDWLDLGKPIMDGDWICIPISASDPDANAAVSHPPQSVLLTVFMEEVPENEEPIEKDLEIFLPDCKLETDGESFSFPVSEKKYKKEFTAYIENGDGSMPWTFSASYKLYDKPDDPLTEISIKKDSDIQVKITLTGPILLPVGKTQSLNKTLVVAAQQKDEEPLERHLKVSVSNIGLFIKNGLNDDDELAFTAKEEVKIPIEFALYRFDPDKDEIFVDKKGYEDLSFELIEPEEKEKNLESVLKPIFTFDKLVTTIPLGRFFMETAEEIPGMGDVLSLNYKVTAPFSGEEEEENFKVLLPLKVTRVGIGEKYPDWDKAYQQCKYVIMNYVPDSEHSKKLYDLLEKRKYQLDKEGLTEMRNQIWNIGSNLILARGAEGYKSVDAWASGIVTVLEWTVWMGDIAFNVVAGYFLGSVGNVGANLAKTTMIDALNFYIYEDAPISVFVERQIDTLVQTLMSVTKGRLISVENIQRFIVKNEAAAWAVFIGIEFGYNLYRTKSIIEAAKQTGRELKDEMLIRTLTNKIRAQAVKKGVKVVSDKELKALQELESLVKTDKLGTKVMDPIKMLEVMADPAKIRTMKEHGSIELQKAFDRTRSKIYREHDKTLKNEIAKQEGIHPEDLIIDDFRTPGTEGKFNLNTDRDYRMLRKYKTADGKEIWLEVAREKWLSKSYKTLGELTNKPSNMSDQKWAEHLQQRGTDKYDAEACADYSDHAIDPKTGERIRVKPNILDVEEGRGVLLDGNDMGRMYKQKVKNASGSEKFAQAKKGVKTIELVREGYKMQGYDLEDLPDNLKEGMKIIKKSTATAESDPTKYNNDLNKHGFRDVDHVMEEIGKKFGELGNAKPPGTLSKIKAALTRPRSIKVPDSVKNAIEEIKNTEIEIK